ncbi:unnamed protein product [Miscanthus lutarioriparius]|uniref:Uncharacterized protein n=1 Tax=Miscanthus lutarioriparius TaxID=422564 RepID=A0A811RY52_9POAL|nr:unnamed protein product [Miscanthus lutarioriparius]
MAEIVGSAVASEAVSRVVSSFLSGDKTSQQESVEDKAERLEMAVLKIRSVVAVTEHLRISHLPLLQWKAKLKRVAEESDDLLHLHKKQTLQCSRASDSTTTGNSISQYLIRAAKHFVPFRRKEDELRLSDSTLRRFERLADGADSFFRLVESGGHPKKSVFLPSLTRALLAGDSMEFLIQTKTCSDHIMLWPWQDHPDAKSGSGLEACLFVSREDEVMWQKGFKMFVLFRLSEASDIVAIAISCLELLPPQFGAARVAISRLLTETIGHSDDHSSISESSKWCCRQTESCHRNDCESSMGDDKHRVNGMLLLSHPVLRFTAICYASPCIDRKGGLPPLELQCHVSPYLLPEKHSSQYELVEQDVIRKLLPNVTDGFYDDERQVLSYQRQIWSPQSSMYCAVAPAFTQPLTASQEYQMKCSGTRSRRRSRTGKTKSQSTSKFQKIAKA